MSRSSYRLREAEAPELPLIDVLEGPNGILVAEFGPDTYGNNVARMRGPYFNSRYNPRLSFAPATTRRSLDVTAANIEQVKQRILDEGWLQAGRIARTIKGVYLNTQGTEGEAELSDYLADSENVEGIWLPQESNVVFVPYKTFRTGDQEVGIFVEGGLARGLEMTHSMSANNLAVIASKDNYPKGVKVFGFDPVGEGEVLHRVVSLYTDFSRLYVGGDNFSDHGKGIAFGVAKEQA